jgi:uncharacterized protein YjbJ (UPF0337 family)
LEWNLLYFIQILFKTLKLYNMSLELKIRGNWNELKGKLKEKYAELTDDDLVYVEGQEDQLLGKIQKKTGAAKAELTEFLFGDSEED